MVALTRKIGKEIVLGKNIFIQVVNIKDGKVTLDIKKRPPERMDIYYQGGNLNEEHAHRLKGFFTEKTQEETKTFSSGEAIIESEKDQIIVIDRRLKFKILKMWANKVEIGFDVPREVPVLRKELYDIIQGKGNNPGENWTP